MTHCDRLYQALSDGRVHDHRELYALGMVVHSRISDLRRRGIQINHWRENGTSYYQLASLAERESTPSDDPNNVGGQRGHTFAGNTPLSLSANEDNTDEPKTASGLRETRFGAGSLREQGTNGKDRSRDADLSIGVPAPTQIVGQLRIEAAA